MIDFRIREVHRKSGNIILTGERVNKDGIGNPESIRIYGGGKSEDAIRQFFAREPHGWNREAEESDLRNGTGCDKLS